MNILIRHRNPLLPLLIVVGFTGCSSTSTFQTTQPLTPHQTEIFHSQVQGNIAKIQLRDGTSVEGQNCRIQRDSLFCEVNSGPIGIPISSIQSVNGTKHVEGMVEGGGIGFFGGALVGAGLLAILYADDEDVGYAAGIGLVLGGAVGLIGGMIYGGIHGHSYTYQFTNE